MRKLTKIQKARMQNAILDATFKELFTWVWWEIFCHKKADKLIKCVEVGMHWKAAFITAKNWR
jgi:hypothetical protein